MDYGRIIRRAVNIVWQYKFLILLGILASLGSGTGGNNFNFSFNGSDFNWQEGQGLPPEFPQELPALPDVGAEVGIAAGLVGLALCAALIVGLLLFVVSSVARGALVVGVNDAEDGLKTNLSRTWSAAWARLGTLLGIGFLPALPVLALVAIGLTSGLAIFGAQGTGVGRGLTALLGGGVGLLICILLPVALVLGLLRTFAERAALMEGMGVLDAYSRGWSVLMQNLGSAIILFVLQIAISIALGVMMFVPGILTALCCFLWPLALIFQGALDAVFSGVWTLAWREWTGDTIKTTV